jgi:hypothetical protein
MIIPDARNLQIREHPAVKAGRAAEAAKAANNPELWVLLARLGGGHHPPPPVPPPPPSVWHLAPRSVLAARIPPRKASGRDIAKAVARAAAKYGRK